jgi:hypothetical protein
LEFDARIGSIPSTHGQFTIQTANAPADLAGRQAGSCALQAQCGMARLSDRAEPDSRVIMHVHCTYCGFCTVLFLLPSRVHSVGLSLITLLTAIRSGTGPSFAAILSAGLVNTYVILIITVVSVGVRVAPRKISVTVGCVIFSSCGIRREERQLQVGLWSQPCKDVCLIIILCETRGLQAKDAQAST